jgi:NADH-quinone oxidoreductase subunit J
MSDFKTVLINDLIFFSIFVVALIFLTLIVFSKNPINIILYLIGFFFDLAVLFIYCGVDYIAILILLLYAGAISIVLLFVVMLLDMKDLLLQKDRIAVLLGSIFLLFFIVLFIKAVYLFYHSVTTFIPRVQYTDWVSLFFEMSNIEVIGLVLYEHYLFQFIVIGFLLFLVMVLIISLIVNHNLLSKKQNLMNQLKERDSIKFSD